MLTKILLTLVVIVGCLLFISAKRDQVKTALPRKVSRQQLQTKRNLRLTAYLFMGGMILVASVMVYLDISEDYETVTVYLVNTETGDRSHYQAQRQNVDNDSFITLEGRQVFASSSERVEMEGR